MTDINKFNLRDGTYIRFTKIGKGEPLVLLHTIRNRLEYFNLVIPYLKDTYTVMQLTSLVLAIHLSIKILTTINHL